MTLRLALLKKTPLQGAHDDLGAIEEQVSHLTAVARDFQQRRRRESFELTAVDLNAVLLEAALLMQNHGVLFGTPPFMVVDGTQPANQVGAGMVIVERLAGLAPIMAYHGDLRRLCRFLLANALRAAGPSGVAVMRGHCNMPKKCNCSWKMPDQMCRQLI